MSALAGGCGVTRITLCCGLRGWLLTALLGSSRKSGTSPAMMRAARFRAASFAAALRAFFAALRDSFGMESE